MGVDAEAAGSVGRDAETEVPGSKGAAARNANNVTGFVRTNTHKYVLVLPTLMPPRVRTETPAQGMLRKNITITPEEAQFLERHPEINQSALFRQIVESLMLAERSPGVASTQPVRLGKAVYRSGAIMFQRGEKRE